MPPTPLQLFLAASRVIQQLVEEGAATKIEKVLNKKGMLGYVVGEVPTKMANERLVQSFGKWKEAIRLQDRSILTEDGGDLIQQIARHTGEADPNRAVEAISDIGFMVNGEFITKDEAAMVSNWFGNDAQQATVRIRGRGRTEKELNAPMDALKSGAFMKDE